MYTNLCTKLWVMLDTLKRDERGVTAIEYALMAAAVAILLAVVLAFTGEDNWFNTIFGQMTDTVTGVMAPPTTSPTQ